jgi:hypothetical protein
MFSLQALCSCGIYAAASEDLSMDQQYFKEKIPRPLSATIRFSKLAFHRWPVHGRTLKGISLERMSLL